MREIIEKRPRLNFEQNCPFLKNEKSKIYKSFRNGFLGIKNIKSMFLPRKNTQKSAKKVENVNFDTLRRPFWIPPFFGGGTLVFKLFSTFSSKMGSRGIKWPIYPEFMMIWNYVQKITPYSPPLLTWVTIIKNMQTNWLKLSWSVTGHFINKNFCGLIQDSSFGPKLGSNIYKTSMLIIIAPKVVFNKWQTPSIPTLPTIFGSGCAYYPFNT